MERFDHPEGPRWRSRGRDRSRRISGAIRLAAVCLLLPGCSGEPGTPADTRSGKEHPPAAEAEGTASGAADAASTDPAARWLVDVDTLKAELNDPRLRILDTRRKDEYSAAHIAGAVHVDIEEWIKNSRREGGLQDTAYWSERIGSLGVARDSRVVVYGETVPNAARVWWMLRYLGVDDVRLLDGSWRQWGRKFYPVENKPPDVEAVTFEPKLRPHMLITREDLKAAIASHDGRLTLVDARSPGEYRGQDAAGQRAGHIPGAVNLEWKEVLDEGNHFFPPDRLQQLLLRLGVEPDKQIVPYCRSGARSSVMTFALTLAGYPTIRHYYGGWLDWSADETAPVEVKAP